MLVPTQIVRQPKQQMGSSVQSITLEELIDLSRWPDRQEFESSLLQSGLTLMFSGLLKFASISGFNTVAYKIHILYQNTLILHYNEILDQEINYEGIEEPVNIRTL